MERAEAEQDIENHNEEEGEVRRPHRAGPVLLLSPWWWRKGELDHSVGGIAELSNFNSALALPFEPNLIIAYLFTFLLFVKILQVGIPSQSKCICAKRNYFLLCIKTTGPILCSLNQQAKSI